MEGDETLHPASQEEIDHLGTVERVADGPGVPLEPSAKRREEPVRKEVNVRVPDGRKRGG